MPTVVLKFGEWSPDQPDFNNPGAATIRNVIPLTVNSYGGMPTPTVYSNALTARCQGCYAFLDDTGAAHIFVGDATKLYQLTAGSAPSFSDISRLAGGAYTTGSPITPAIPTAPSWCMTAFGKRIIATNYADAIQTFLVGTDMNFSLLAAAAPNARFAAVIRDFLMVGNTTDATFGAQPRRLWWPAIGDPTSWPTPGTNAAIQVQSDYQDLEQSDLGQVTGLGGGHLSAADGAAFCERGIYSIQYVGSGAGIFSFQVAQGSAGTQSPLSLIQTRLPQAGRAVIAYFGGDDFYAFDGAQSIPLGVEKWARTVIADIDPHYLSMVQGGSVPASPFIYWLYNSLSGAGAGLYDKLVIYNTVIQRGALVDLSSTPAEWGTQAMGVGFTLDALDVFGSLDAVPASLDSSLWAAGLPVLAAFDSNHKLNFLNGAYMAPTVETTELEPFPGRRARITLARPLSDGGTASIQIGVRDRLQDAVTWKTAVAMNSLGSCPQRVTGRYVRARMTLPAGSTFAHLQGVALDVQPEGLR